MQVEENKTVEKDLLAELTQATEFKQPSAAAGNSWDFTNDEKETVTPTPNGTTAPGPITPGSDEPANKLSKSVIKADAEASQAGVEFLTSMLAEFIITFKYYKKFSPEQREALNEDLLDRRQDSLDEDQLILVNRWHRLMKQKNAKIKKIEFTETKRQRMINAFEKYSEITGKTFLTPGYMLGIGITESVLTTAIEAFLD